jgi:oxalate decarboxylase
MVKKNTGWSRQAFDRLPQQQLYIFDSVLPGPLEDDKRFLGRHLETERSYTFRMAAMEPTVSSPGGTARIVDSTSFPVSTTIAAAMVTIRPGAMREMHWHPDASEWQYWIKGRARMTVVTTRATARTVDLNANDVAFVPSAAGHCIENTGSEDAVFLELFRAPRYHDISLNQWIARLPDKMAEAHLKLPLATIRSAPQTKQGLVSE